MIKTKTKQQIQQHLSDYGPDFDQSLKLGLWDQQQQQRQYQQ